MSLFKSLVFFKYLWAVWEHLVQGFVSLAVLSSMICSSKEGTWLYHLCFPCRACMSVTLLIQTVLLDSKILDDSAYFAEGFIERLGGRGSSHTPTSLFSPPTPVACPCAPQVSGIFSLLLTHTFTQKSSLPPPLSWGNQLLPSGSTLHSKTKFS